MVTNYAVTNHADVIRIARVCYYANRAYCQSIGDYNFKLWETAPQWQRDTCIDGVEFHLNNPRASVAASHENWLKVKEKEGWVYGPVKDPEKKTHPCIMDHASLPREQQAKDYIFRAIVHAMMFPAV